MIYKETERYKLLHGDVLEELKTLPDNSIDCVMTSPPYWALRDYGVDDQLGMEPNFEIFVDKLVSIFDEVKRVLKDEGTCWVNIGDTYFGGGTGQDKSMSYGKYVKENFVAIANALNSRDKSFDYPNKSLCLVPERFAQKMIEHGWILRNQIIWYKPNAMPSSVSDRFTVDFEKVFFFVKSKKYFFETQREPHKHSSVKRAARARLSEKLDAGQYSTSYTSENVGYYDLQGKLERGELRGVHAEGRNKRCVWEINTKGFHDAHFAVYPEELCETPLKAGCPEFVCSKCGVGRQKIFTKVGSKEVGRFGGNKHSDGDGNFNPTYSGKTEIAILEETGLTDCGCGVHFVGGVVLDPFAGSSTTGVVALKQRKRFIGIDINQEYLDISVKRLEETDYVVEDEKKQMGVFDFGNE